MIGRSAQVRSSVSTRVSRAFLVAPVSLAHVESRETRKKEREEKKGREKRKRKEAKKIAARFDKSSHIFIPPLSTRRGRPPSASRLKSRLAKRSMKRARSKRKDRKPRPWQGGNVYQCNGISALLACVDGRAVEERFYYSTRE